MTNILHRQIRHTLPVAVSGRGVHITDSTGRDYIDASGGAAVSCLGHGHPDVIAAMHAQIDRLAYAHTSFFTTEVAEQLAEQLVRTAPAGTSHAYFVSGGSEAVEAALKMARQYFVEIGQPQRQHFIARRQSYHGNTLGALAVGGNLWRRQQFAPLLIPVTHVSPCYEYRDRSDDESAEAYGQRLVAELAEAIDQLGGDNVIAFVAETVGGATSGALTPVPGYLQGVRELCDAPRHPADPGRGDVRHGPHRHAARLRAGRRGARPAGHRQGPGRRLPAHRRGAGAGPCGRRVCAGQRACSSTATPTWATRWPVPRRWRCSR